MLIKEAIIEEEKIKVKAFLLDKGLDPYQEIFNNDVKTLYIEKDTRIIGTVSCESYIIKWLAIDENYQGENLVNELISNIINYLHQIKCFYYQVFTKCYYEEIFHSLNFKTIAKTKQVVLLEAGITDINNEIEKIQRQINYQLVITPGVTDVASIVMNANPFTNGHLALVEKAVSEHQYVIVWLLETDKSLFSYEERLAMTYLACRKYERVIVLPSTKYIISTSTFPSYFIKDINELTKETALLDAIIFKEYFMNKLGIMVRYVGDENEPLMVLYNDTLKEILGNKLIIAERTKQNNVIISASLVRNLLKQNKLDEALSYIPKENHMLMKKWYYDKK